MSKSKGAKSKKIANDFKPFSLNDCPLKGMNLIEASAGTGKTYNIIRIFLRLLLEPDKNGNYRSIKEILVVTFTRAAADELLENIRSELYRIRKYLNNNAGYEDDFSRALFRRIDKKRALEQIRRSLLEYDQAAICTIHSFCHRVINSYSFETDTPLNAEIIADESEFIDEFAQDYWRRIIADSPQPFVAHALESGFEPQLFIKIIRFGMRHHNPHLPLTIKPTLRSSYQGFNDKITAIRNSWVRLRNEIEEIFKNAIAEKNLHKTYFNHINLEQRLLEMDAFCESKDFSPALFGAMPDKKNGNFQFFTAGYIRNHTNADKKPPEHQFFTSCEELQKEAQELRREMDQYLLFIINDILLTFRSALVKKKLPRNLLSYDDLILRLHSALFDKEKGGALKSELQKCYSAVLIDEFQDTDAIQWEIFNHVFNSSEHVLFLIGDPKQSIYDFRHADINTYFKAVSEVKNRFTLEHNFRSTKPLIQAINAIFSRPNPFLLNKIEYRPAISAENADPTELIVDNDPPQPLIIWVPADNETRKALPRTQLYPNIQQAVCGEILRLLELAKDGKARIGKRPLLAGDIAILVRKNHEAEEMHRRLQEFGISSSIRIEKNIFDTPEADQFYTVLRAIENPANLYLLRAALATELLGFSGEQIDHTDQQKFQMSEICRRFIDYKAIYFQHGFMPMFQKLVRRESIHERLARLPDGLRKLTNLNHLCEVLHRESLKRRGIELTALFRRCPEAFADENVRPDNDGENVQIVTVHLSKGLEYPIVFCPFSWSASPEKVKEISITDIPDPENSGKFWESISAGGAFLPAAALDLFKKNIDQPQFFNKEQIDFLKNYQTYKDLAGELRLFYTAVTRAIFRCYLVWGRIKGCNTSALSYLFHEKREKIKEGKPPVIDLDLINRVQLIEQLKEIEEKGRGAIALCDMPLLARDPLNVKHFSNIKELNLKPFAGKIVQGFSMTSYSALLSQSEATQEIEATEPDLFFHKTSLPAEVAGRNIFSFPRGIKTGLFFHRILEQYFSRRSQDLISIIEKTADEFKLSAWNEITIETIQQLFRTPLHPNDPESTLGTINPEECIVEMEFYFPIHEIKKESFLTSLPPSLNSQKKKDIISKLSLTSAEGFMRGFIDLIFRYKDRYFLIDWKTNHLGNSTEDYHKKNLAAVMEEDRYSLQYYIYLVALDSYLKERIANYDYNHHIGGIYYLFLRGINQERGPDFGIFHDRPDFEILNWFSLKLKNEGYLVGSN